MDIHAPHHPVRTWRDFFTHIAIVTIGLFIALMLEAGLEWLHHRHLLHEAESNLAVELSENRTSLAKDEKHIQESQLMLKKDIQILIAAKNHETIVESRNTDLQPPQKFRLLFEWSWSGMQTAAWDTAHGTGALALMPYDHAQSYAVMYGQQAIVEEQAAIYIRDIYHSQAPLQGGRHLADLETADLDAMIAASEQTLVDLKLLDDLCHSLDNIYRHRDGKV